MVHRVLFGGRNGIATARRAVVLALLAAASLGAGGRALAVEPTGEAVAVPHPAVGVARGARLGARPGTRPGARPLTVRVRPNRPVSVARREVEPPVDDFVFRNWNDTRVRTYYGFRLGGNVFYGDTRGDPINYGNAGLAGISGYGGARGGFGGPHFDSVGGFHPGPGPEYKEALDYASGRIWTPDYDVPPPAYPSVKARVAALNVGLAPAGSEGTPTRVRAFARLTPARATRPASPVAPELARPSEDDDDAGRPPAGRPASEDDLFSGFDLDGL